MKENKEASESILVDVNSSLVEQEKTIDGRLKSLLASVDPETPKLDGIFNVAGGWAGGNASSAEFLANSELMWKQSVWSSLISASLATRHLKEHGVLTLPGAAACADMAPTPGMIGYGMAKVAVHHLAKSLSTPSAGLPASASVFALMPVTLDTPMNRRWMPKADFGKWTPLSYIAELANTWLCDEAARPHNGALVKLTTQDGATTLTFH